MSQTKDLSVLVKHVQSLRPQATTANRTGTSVNTLGYEGVVVVVNAGLWTDGTHTIDIQDSADNSSFAQVPAANLIGTKPVVNSLASDEQDYEVGVINARQYVRVDIGVAAATTGAVLGASVMLGLAGANPA